ncbi:MAG: 30S ribosomal protein S7 [Candidatus Fischerbacteria bacterium RBG_13_37_8]|uniref:Small ribosomal subunit protein uS7 n=1 Tax=Candidatus Fischerbacteria bacterium RBG_13_37_8 TaxID=1817863 RepID=A0A1F5V972_9BACT|nr:MAG: 30S ribosomal protein S7 [Candidatus Fischerbacteria bacterium RBG_13_37_8]
MPRKGSVKRREVKPDAVFQSVLVAKFINCIMSKGKKSLAEKMLYDAFVLIKEKTNEDALKVFYKAIDNAKPRIEVRSRRIGGATYQIPIDVPEFRATSLGIRWIIDSARRRNEKTMVEKLCNEILDAYNNRGTAIKKREDTHKMAEANKAFAHYRW